ncbi:MAG TPA: hypothetical protein VFB06_06085 [Streptosporangiaceae bacterium]|nr:hypothetical protein [Streptosporangiaceae bacterium]
MWDNFMRGNWPVAAPAVPAGSDEAPAHRTVADAPATRMREPAAATMVAAFAEARPRQTPGPRRTHRTHRRLRMSARLAATFGAG